VVFSGGGDGVRKSPEHPAQYRNGLFAARRRAVTHRRALAPNVLLLFQRCMQFDKCGDGLRVGCNHPFALDLSCPIDDADRCQLQRIESSFATVRHRTVRSKGCLSNKTALAMIFKLAEAAESWRRLNGHNQLPKIILGVRFTDGIEVVRSQAQPAAAWTYVAAAVGQPFHGRSVVAVIVVTGPSSLPSPRGRLPAPARAAIETNTGDERRGGKGEEAAVVEPIEPGERKPIDAWCKSWSEREAP
jgi:hypothetical protein